MFNFVLIALSCESKINYVSFHFHLATYQTVEHTTYLLARDEDCENTFHSTADFMNMMLVMRALEIPPERQQVVLFDNHPDGPYMELIKAAYSPNHPILRHKDYDDKVVHFKHVVFHLESPAGLIFPKVANPDPLRCHSTSLFQVSVQHYNLKIFVLILSIYFIGLSKVYFVSF